MPYKFGIGMVLLSLTAIVATTLSLGSALQVLIDQGIKEGNQDLLSNAILRIICLILTLGFASFIRSYFIYGISEKVTIDIRRQIYSHLLTLKYPEFETLKVSDITSRLSSDMDLVSRIIIDAFSYCIRNSMIFICGIIMMFTESARLAFIVLIAVPLIILCLRNLSTKVRALSRKTQIGVASLTEKVSETFQGIQTIYALNAQEHKKLEFVQNTEEFLNLSLERLRYRSMFFALAITGIMCLITFVIWLGSLDVLSGKMSAGSLVSFIFYAAYSAASIGGVAEIFGEMQRSLAGLERVMTLLEISNREDSNVSCVDFSENSGSSIKFQDVSFAYPSRPELEILHEISFSIKPGEFVAIVGSSGSGKSTIAQLLLGFFEPSKGQIQVFDKDRESINPHALRKLIAYVPQNPFMFSGSIIENLNLSADTSKDIEEAAKVAGLDDIARELPNELETFIGAAGTQISGGQRQRIAITRAVLSKARVLFLDEATSALDQLSERLVMQRIKEAMQGATIISIAHRISSIEHADRILVMDSGRIIAEGTHTELLNRCSLYQQLCHEEKLT